jgi:three-Cys-motif partner protein
MRDADGCTTGGFTKANGNCTNPDPVDGLSVQCVGPWAVHKHDYLERYIEATRQVRKKYLEPSGKGGAAFIDLFAGPGRARIFTNGTLIDGSPLMGLKHTAAPFSRVIVCDNDLENVEALRKRTAPYGCRAVVVPGNCHEQIDSIMDEIPKYGLNLALVDPYSLDELQYPTLAKLGTFERMDMLIHFPTGDAKRNHAQGAAERLARATGSTRVRELVRKPTDTVKAIHELRASLEKLGYTGFETRTAPIRNTNNVILYHLVYVSKDNKGDVIWNSIVRTTATRQRSLPGFS